VRRERVLFQYREMLFTVGLVPLITLSMNQIRVPPLTLMGKEKEGGRRRKTEGEGGKKKEGERVLVTVGLLPLIMLPMNQIRVSPLTLLRKGEEEG
jgi:hypothetical protein